MKAISQQGWGYAAMICLVPKKDVHPQIQASDVGASCLLKNWR